ncbi:MAG TPA: isoprenylcysteine carboxylmethyltransferase family protein [Terriglobia bacterium]|nr:isoprenylcysteine carboxylmethyltransferase family protein [Terriglobia bacterium]
MDNAFSRWAARWRVPLGFATGIAYLILARPTVRLLTAGAAVALLGLIVRGYAAGCVDKNQSLATAGAYAYTRNPLYLGSCLVGAGFALAGNSWIVAALFGALFAIVYWPVMRREEDFLRRRFGDEYDRYARKAPFFLPTRGKAVDSARGFRWRRYRQNREYEALLGYAVAVLLLALKMILR